MEKTDNISFSYCTNILSGDYPSFLGIAAGESRGDMWVDNIGNPTLALVYSFAVGGFSIMGSPQDVSVYNDLIKFLREELFLELKEKGINYFEFSVVNKKTEEYILQLFKGENINQENEYFYRKYEANNNTQEIDTYNIVKIDSGFIKQLQSGKFDNPEILNKKILKSWGTYEDFLARSVGYAATFASSIAAVILGTARYQNIIPIDIETGLEHRKMGLASTLTNHFVKACVSRGLTPQWNCVESNIASRKTAEKTGFKFIKKKPYYWFEI